jgi:hypothetical protein
VPSPAAAAARAHIEAMARSWTADPTDLYRAICVADTRPRTRPRTRSASDPTWPSAVTPASLAAMKSPVSRTASATTSAMMTSARAMQAGSTSRCSGSVDPIETTVIPGSSQSPSRTGFSSRERAAQTTSDVPATAARGVGTALTGTPRRAVGELGLKGVSVSTNVAGRELADPAFDPAWEAAADLGAVIFIHPWGCSLGARLSAHYLGNTFGQPAETALALSHLIFGGTLDRHPGLRLLAAHGGGFLPTYIGRSDHAWRSRDDARGCARPPSEYLREIWYDALVYTPQALRHLVEAVGADRVAIGTDYPFDMGVTNPVERVLAAALPATDQTAILTTTAATLFTLTT